eukprot:m.51595 g.51595  ORF g.51595 m.51595 type:complete len:106 (+) comp11247_c0_seq2:1616-1933(+)
MSQDWFMESLDEELHLLYACYNQTMGLLSRLGVGNMPKTLEEARSYCADPEFVNEELARCARIVGPQEHPWFLRSTLVYHDDIVKHLTHDGSHLQVTLSLFAMAS